MPCPDTAISRSGFALDAAGILATSYPVTCGIPRSSNITIKQGLSGESEGLCTVLGGLDLESALLQQHSSNRNGVVVVIYDERPRPERQGLGRHSPPGRRVRR